MPKTFLCLKCDWKSDDRILSTENDHAPHLYLHFSFSLVHLFPFHENILSWFRGVGGLLGTLERPELNLNQKAEVKRCSKTGNQQDLANQPHSTFPLIPSSSSLILLLSCFSLCWHSFLFPEIVRLLSYLACGQWLLSSLWHSNLITTSNPIVANAIKWFLRE